MKIFFDLDGTLIDASERLYRLFCDLIPECTFSKEEYWNLKRNKINHQMILEKYFPQYNFDDFNKKWLDLIETDKYLKLDKIYEEVPQLLFVANKIGQVYLLTARQARENLLKELKELDIQKYFKEILVTENKRTKLEILQDIDLNKNDIFISDTGKDIQIAKEANIKSIAVSYGFMSEEKLSDYKPDFICDSIKKVREILDD